jgi:hypothetical protein
MFSVQLSTRMSPYVRDDLQRYQDAVPSSLSTAQKDEAHVHHRRGGPLVRAGDGQDAHEHAQVRGATAGQLLDGRRRRRRGAIVVAR